MLITLGILLLLLALNAFAGGYYGMAGAKDIPLSWLDNSPFRNYFLPGLFLFTFIGGSAVIAAIAVLKQKRFARASAIVCATITILWLIVQVAIIGYVSWMQPATAALTVIIFLLALKLPRYER